MSRYAFLFTYLYPQPSGSKMGILNISYKIYDQTFTMY